MQYMFYALFRTTQGARDHVRSMDHNVVQSTALVLKGHITSLKYRGSLKRITGHRQTTAGGSAARPFPAGLHLFKIPPCQRRSCSRTTLKHSHAALQVSLQQWSAVNISPLRFLLNLGSVSGSSYFIAVITGNHSESRADIAGTSMIERYDGPTPRSFNLLVLGRLL